MNAARCTTLHLVHRIALDTHRILSYAATTPTNKRGDIMVTFRKVFVRLAFVAMVIGGVALASNVTINTGKAQERIAEWWEGSNF